MPLYAHAHIEDPRTDTVIKPGGLVPNDLPGVDDLIASGAVADTQRELNVVLNDAGQVVRRIDEAGVVNRTAHVKRFLGHFTGQQLKDPDVETPLLGVQQPSRFADPPAGVHDEGEGQD